MSCVCLLRLQSRKSLASAQHPLISVDLHSEEPSKLGYTLSNELGMLVGTLQKRHRISIRSALSTSSTNSCVYAARTQF